MDPIFEILIKVLVVTVVALTGFAYLTLLERKFIGRLQSRIGPNRAGPFGLLQPVAEAIKLIFKESSTPAMADKPIYFLAPILAVVPAIMIFAFVPFGPGDIFQIGAKVPVAVILLAAIIGTAAYGVALAGWASNNKYATLGGMRAAAQVVSYELAMGLAMVAVVLMAGAASMTEIVERQLGYNVLSWYIARQPVAAAIFAITALAELARAPFDLVEAEQELTAGYITEYGGMKFALFFMSEYMKMIGLSALFVTFFLGGWDGPFASTPSALGAALGVIYFTIKVIACLLLMVLVRATLPRVRYDKLMGFGWKRLMPIALANVVVTAALIVTGVPGYK